MKLLDASPEVVTVELAGGPARFHALWLRDNARGDASRHTDNDQRLFDVTELADEVVVASAEVVDGQLLVAFAPDGTACSFEAAWLEAHRYDGPPGLGDARPGAISWVAADLAVHRLTWADRDDPVAVAAATRALVSDGVVVVDGLAAGDPGDGVVPTPGVPDVARLWGPVRETNYGKVFFVRAEAEPTNMAFTPKALNVHTDTPYRRPVPGYQVEVLDANSRPLGPDEEGAIVLRLREKNAVSSARDAHAQRDDHHVQCWREVAHEAHQEPARPKPFNAASQKRAAAYVKIEKRNRGYVDFIKSLRKKYEVEVYTDNAPALVVDGKLRPDLTAN